MDVAMLRDREEIDYFCKLIYETTHIPVFYINRKLDIQTGFPATFITNPIHPSINELFEHLDFFNDPNNTPVLRSTNFLENFISIKVGVDDELQAIWVLGPSVYTDVTEETIHGLINDFQIKRKTDVMRDYYRSLPIVSKLSLLHVGLMAMYLLFSRRLSVADVIQKDSSLGYDLTIKENPDLHISKNRQDISFHSSYEWEQAIFSCVREGRKEELLEKLTVPDIEGKPGVLSKNSHLRNIKNLTISAITLATRYAIDGGVNSEIAYTMSDLYIQSLEDMKNVAEVQNMMREVLCDFTDRVNEVKYHKYSTPVLDCQSYIFKHLYGEITLAHLAKVANMHQNYLSALFKKEVGVTISEYILIQKIEEAKKLLSFSDYTLAEIYTWLNFHDQSHFTKVFKKYTGETPKKYKSHHRS